MLANGGKSALGGGSAVREGHRIASIVWVLCIEDMRFNKWCQSSISLSQIRILGFPREMRKKEKSAKRGPRDGASANQEP